MALKGTPFRADLKPLDTLLFGDDEENASKIQHIPIEQLSPFKDHPFKMYSDEKMKDMTASITAHGIMTPLVVRPHPDGELEHYEIISGHNRHEGARQAGLDDVPVIVRDVDNATAILMMISSNFEQRDELLPSEKAFAYKMQLDAISCQGQRNDLHKNSESSRHDGEKLSVEKVSETTDESSRQIHRYIRLTELIPPLLDRVDNRSLPFVAAVDLSYLSHEQQTSLDELLTVEGIKTVSNAQAAHMKEHSRNGTLDDIEIVRILHDKPEPILASIKMTKQLQERIPPDTLPKDAENIIISAMDFRSVALSNIPNDVKEQDMPKVLERALNVYFQKGYWQDDLAASFSDNDAETTNEDEDMER